MTDGVPVAYRITVGKSKNQKTWRDVRDVTWPELCTALTDHKVGQKDGYCFIPAAFRGTRRIKSEAETIGLLVLDCDTGESLEQIRLSIQKAGWAAIIYSTHSHLTIETEIAKAAYEKKGYEQPSLYLVQEKGMQESVATGAYLKICSDPQKLIIVHNPCPKFRVVMPLALPWKAADFPSQDIANNVWSQFVMKAAQLLGLHHDQSCIDSSRLYYFPRHPESAEFVTEVLEGMPIDAGTIIHDRTALELTTFQKDASKLEEKFLYKNESTSKELDLVKWAARNAESFDIVGTLYGRKPGIFTGHIADGYKHHIRCVNSDMHTKQEPDDATFIVSPPQSLTRSFVYCCMHAHCRDLDRLFFIQKMLEEGWLLPEDVSDEDERQPTLSFDEIRQLCESLSRGSHPDEAAAVIIQIVKAKIDPIHIDFLLGIIKDKTGVSLKTLRQSISAAKEGGSVDTAYFIAQKTLDTYFAGGKHLIRAEDKSFWRYTGKCWTPIGNEQVENYILPMVKKYADPLIGEEYRKMTKNALDLLIARQALDVDFFMRLGDMPSVINCQNGELWLQPDGSVSLEPHRPESYLQYVLDVIYDPSAICPVFDQALLDTFANSSNPADMVRHLQEVMGYFIQPARFLTCWFMWHGEGSNGKTKLFETLERLVSRSAIHSERIDSLEKSRFGLGYLMGKILFVDDDVDVRTKLPDGLLKKLSERKLITGEKKFKDTFEFICAVVTLLLANNYPLCDDLSHGTRRRVRIIPFKRKFDKNKDGPNPYPYIWENELPGVLNRLIQGLTRLRCRGDFLEPEDCEAAREEWLIHANPFNAFMSECCEQDKESYAALNDIFARFNIWKIDNGYTNKMTLQSLHKALKGSGYGSGKIHGCIRIYGLSLL